MKLEVGMYLRHSGLEGEYPIIQKITELRKPGRCGGEYKAFTDKCGDWFIDSDYIELNKSKYSFDLLELIEVGDIIKFDITDIDNYADIQGYNCWEISCEEELNGVKEMIEMESAKLLSIITHEQIESMEYRVGE